MTQSSAAPDLTRYQGQRYVVKLGGEIMQHATALDALAADTVALTQAGIHVVLIHGGGPQADALAAQLGHTVRKVAGRRVTDDAALAVAKWVYGGSINVELLGALKGHGGRGVGLSGVDGDLITVQRRPPLTLSAADGTVEQVDFGHVGDVTAVNGALIELLWAGGYIPVVASLAADTAGAIYNVNADTIATALAVALAATGLLLLTNVPGILRARTDPASLVTHADAATIQALIADGTIAGGMLPKVQNALDALTAGVAQVQILDGTQPHRLRDSFLHVGLGTTMHATTAAT